MAIVIAIIWPMIVSPFWLHLFNLALIAIVAATGLNLLCGTARLISLGQAAFMGVGGFTVSFFATEMEWSLPISLLLAFVAGCLAGGLIALPSLRLKAIYVAITTLALHFVFITGASIYQSEVVQSHGIVMPIAELGPLTLLRPEEWYHPLLLVAAVAVVAASNIRRSYLGRRWIAVADHEVAASALGIDVHRSKISAFAITSGIVALAGGLAAYYEGVVSAETYDLHMAIAYLAVIIVGGVGSVLGSIIGAIVITLLPYILDAALGLFEIGQTGGGLNGLHSIVYGLLIIFFMLFEPLGLAEVWRRIRDVGVTWPFRVRSAQGGSDG
ncbi:MAG: branched-chain amino acid ABC transporter permease [Alphaproteobacteria bacterium]